MYDHLTLQKIKDVILLQGACLSPVQFRSPAPPAAQGFGSRLCLPLLMLSRRQALQKDTGFNKTRPVFLLSLQPPDKPHDSPAFLPRVM